MSKKTERTVYADDATERVGQLLSLRLPWLIVGLLGGMLATRVAAYFETLLTSEVALAFFIPVIVYMSDAVGTQTETIYVRNLSKRQLNFWVYLAKELTLGLILGLIFGFAIGAFAFLWLEKYAVALVVGLAMFASIVTATVISLVIPSLLYRGHTDPAVGAGPFTTVIQDLISLLIYFLIATLIIF